MSDFVSAAVAEDERVQFLIRSSEHPLDLDGPNVIRNLTSHPKKISSMYVYDKSGSRLFERQCETPEYYLRRAELRLLTVRANEIIELCGYPMLVELGAGTATKTRLLLEVYANHQRRCEYYPIDIDGETLIETAWALTREFSRLRVHCLSATYQNSLSALPHSEPRLFLFLGSSLGNMELDEIDDLLAQMFHYGSPGDHLLVGVDLHKDAAIIDRAYNDSAGWGPRSTLNMLSHLNRRYGGDFQLRNFAYRSRYNAPLHRNEVRIESLIDQIVTLEKLNFRVAFARSERIDAEVMYKFDPDELTALLRRHGFAPVRQWIDSRHRYGLFLAHRDRREPVRGECTRS